MTTTKKQRFALTRAGLTPFEPVIPYEEADERAAAIVAEMTAEEKFDMVCGRGFYIAGCKRVGVPDIDFTDASQGVHLREQFPAGKLHRSVSFPSAMTLTATWNRKLAAEFARSVGEECRAGGIHVLLGPGMNIYRISQCGRNFEYTGEDPCLASEMIYVYVTALQRTGVIATLKHFVANETDYWRKLSNSIVGRRALKELYLRAFQSGIEAGALAVMTSYNQLGGEYCGQGADVINGLLRDELGFRHLVMTDWTSVTDGKKLAASGQDLEMPHGECLKQSRDDVIGSAEIDRMVRSIVRTFTMMGFLDFEHEQPAYLENLEIHEDVAFRTACEGTVLLRNEGVLPLEPDVGERIVVTGNWASRTPLAGKGSGYVEGYENQSYAEAIAERFAHADVVARQSPSDAELAGADTVIVCTGFEHEGEGRDRSFRLPESEDALVARACELAKEVIVIVTSGGGIAMDWHDGTKAILQCPFTGQRGAEALAAIISGDVNPSGKLPFSIEIDFADSPGAGYIPEGGCVHDRVQGGQPGAPKPEYIKTKEWPYEIRYEEGVYVGYRWYDAKQKPVRYWFGHGLSYTTFSYSDLSVDVREPGLWEVSVTVKNSGEVAGGEVVQLYVEDRASGADRPRRELKAFDKVFLDPGERRVVRLLVSEADLEYFDETSDSWVHSSGEYGIHVGSSYDDIRLTGQLIAD